MPHLLTQTLAPLFFAAAAWLNGGATHASLAHKVVIVDVFTVDCYNCRNVTPNLRSLYRSVPHEKLAIVGVHTPETPYERQRSHVVAEMKDLGIAWPVVLDNDNAIWNAYGIEAWPTQLIFDKHGRWRKTVVGDSQDDDVDRTVKALLAER